MATDRPVPVRKPRPNPDSNSESSSGTTSGSGQGLAELIAKTKSAPSSGASPPSSGGGGASRPASDRVVVRDGRVISGQTFTPEQAYSHLC